MIPRRNIQRVPVQRVSASNGRKPQHGGATTTDMVAIEEPLEIRLVFTTEMASTGMQSHDRAGERVDETRTQSVSITMRTPGADYELAAGFLVGEGILRDPDELREIRYCVGKHGEEQQYNVLSVRLRPGVRPDIERLRRNFYTTSSCGVCGKASLEALKIQSCPLLAQDKPLITEQVVFGLEAKLRDAQAVFSKTGGLHGAALFDAQGALICAHEDVGRHNAVDKLIGEQFLQRRLPLSDCVMLVSGRTSFEIMQKALMGGIAVVAAVGAPSSLAVELARNFGMTLLGFVRGETFNIYTGAQRIVRLTGAAT